MTRNNVHRAFAHLLPAAPRLRRAAGRFCAEPPTASIRQRPIPTRPLPTGRRVDHAREATACLRLTERAPEAAFESALTWEDRGGEEIWPGFVRRWRCVSLRVRPVRPCARWRSAGELPGVQKSSW